MERVFYFSLTGRSLVTLSVSLAATLVLAFLAGTWTAAPVVSEKPLLATSRIQQQNQGHEASDSVIIGRSADTFTIQIGAFRSETNASDLASSYETKGYGPYVLNTTDDTGTHWFSVRVGFYHDKDQARQVADQLVAQDNTIHEVLVRPVNVL